MPKHLREGDQIAYKTGHRDARHAVEAGKRPEDEEIERLKNTLNDMAKIIHNMTVAQQAAWIEWKHGKGADDAMMWIQNGLFGPGHIPDEDEPYGKDAQAYYDANRSDPFPVCYCGRPSNILWMGQGFCCHEHYKSARRK